MSDGHLAAALKNVLPQELHQQADTIAALLGSLLRGEADPAATVARIADPSLAPALAALAGRSVPADGAPVAFAAAGEAGVVQQITIGQGGAAHGDFVGVQINLPPPAPTPVGGAPLPPPILVGRGDDIGRLRAMLGPAATAVVFGWPGVGKTSIAAALAHDPTVAAAFPDGALWASLGPEPSLLAALAAWGRQLSADDLIRGSVPEASDRLRALLQGRRALLVVDDVWDAAHAAPFRVGGPACATLLTSRLTDVAQALAPVPAALYRLPVLGEPKALALLATLAPTAVRDHRDACALLARELEGLPLALQVAGRLLNAEAAYGFGVEELLQLLRDGAAILAARAPADRADPHGGTIPTVAVLLQTSTDRLDPEARERFAYLGAFAPKPATFDLEALAAVWEVDDPRPTARTLVDRGLLEPIGDGRFWLHALLVSHAYSLCEP